MTAKPQLIVDALHGAPGWPGAPMWWARTRWATRSPRTVLTDARSGRQIDAWDSIETATGDGKSLYSGTVPLETTLSGSTYQLKDPHAGNTYTGDAANRRTCVFGVLPFSRAPATLFTGRRQPLGNRAPRTVPRPRSTPSTARTRPGTAPDVHGRTGIAGDGKGSYNRVH